MRQQFDVETLSLQDGSKTTDEMVEALRQITQALVGVQQTKGAMGRQFDGDLIFMNTEMTWQEGQLLLAKPKKNRKPLCEALLIAAEWEATDDRCCFFGRPCRSAVLPGVAEDAREVEGPSEASSEAHGRQQGLPGVCEQDAREVGGYDDDEAD
jgi:hypothetical protein